MNSQSPVADEILAGNRYCVLATSSRDGSPWITPLFYNYDSSYVIYWESARDARHSRLLVENPNVAIVVADLDGTRAVYLECTAAEVLESDRERALDCFLHGPHQKADQEPRTIGDYGPDRPIALFTATPFAAHVMTGTKRVEGYRIDDRVPIDLHLKVSGA